MSGGSGHFAILPPPRNVAYIKLEATASGEPKEMTRCSCI